jgi:hypothetical protein
MQYWYNVTTGQVEDDATRSRDDEVMGPYATKDEAAKALTHARENTERWDAEDRRWNDADNED